MDWPAVFDALPSPAACLQPGPTRAGSGQRFELLAVNHAFSALFDRPAAGLLGLDLLELIAGHGAGRADWERALARPLAEGSKTSFLRSLPGLDRWLGVEADLLPGGKLIVLFADLTRYIRAFPSEASQHSNLLAIFDGMDDFIYVADPETHELLYMNEALRRVFGQATGLRCFQVLQGRDTPCPFCNNDRLFGPAAEDSFVWENLNSVTGRWLRCVNRVISWSDGRLVRLEIAVDIDDYKRAEQGLRDSEEMFRTISTSARDGIVVIDDTGDVTVWNEAAGQIFGYGPEEIIGRNLHLLISPPDMRTAHTEAFGRFRSSGEGTAIGRTLELPGIRKDGTQVPVELSLSAAQMGGRWYGFGIVRDISERKRIEAQLLQAKRETDAANRRLELAIEQANRMAAEADTANRTKSRFLANMSHEIRTPMNGVIGMIALLLQTELNSEQRDFAETVGKSAEHLLELVNDILDFSKVEAGKLQLEQIAYAPAGILEEVADLVSFNAAKQGIRLETRIDPDLPERLLGDPGRLRQVLINLAGNAVKFTSRGIVRLEVDLWRLDAEQADLRFSVSDTGRGIPKDKLESIFRPFEQADDSTTRVYGGTGLGLSISRNLVALMGGRLEVDSRPGQGSTFWFTASFPLLGADAHVAAAGSGERLAAPGDAVPELSPEGKRRARLLLVEDNPTNRKVALSILAKGGYSADPVETGRQALEALGRVSYDLVLIDVQMPRMDGLEVTRRLRSGERGVLNPEVPVIALTGHACEGDRERFLAAGMDGYIAKPFDPDELLAAVARWLAFQQTEVQAVSARLQTGSGPPAGEATDLDWPSLVSRMSDDEELAREVLAGFVAEAPGLIASILAALGDGDTAAAEGAAHQLKGAAGNASAEGLRRAAAAIESGASEGQLAPIASAQADLEALFGRLADASVGIRRPEVAEAACSGS